MGGDANLGFELRYCNSLKLAADGRRQTQIVKRFKGLTLLKSVRLHKLSGDRAGQWAMTVNGPWRICFRFKNGNAYDVEIIDHHKG